MDWWWLDRILLKFVLCSFMTHSHHKASFLMRSALCQSTVTTVCPATQRLAHPACMWGFTEWTQVGGKAGRAPVFGDSNRFDRKQVNHLLGRRQQFSDYSKKACVNFKQNGALGTSWKDIIRNWTRSLMLKRDNVSK